MRHVFVETNWVVAYAAPEHLRLREALGLAERARAGELHLYLPSVCLAEARYPIRSKFQPRLPADSVRKYLGWAAAKGKLSSDEATTVRRVLDQYQGSVSAELERLDERLRSLIDHPGIEVFALREDMLARAVELATQNLDLKPFDQAILAAVLVFAEELRDLIAGAYGDARVVVADDTAIALRGAIPAGPGIVLIAGTGLPVTAHNMILVHQLA